MCASVHANVHASVHVCEHVCVHACERACVRACMCAYTRACMCACLFFAEVFEAFAELPSLHDWHINLSKIVGLEESQVLNRHDAQT